MRDDEIGEGREERGGGARRGSEEENRSGRRREGRRGKAVGGTVRGGRTAPSTTWEIAGSEVGCFYYASRNLCCRK